MSSTWIQHAKPEYITGIGDAALLRALAEDLPSCVPEIRTQLRKIAEKISGGESLGTMRWVVSQFER